MFFERERPMEKLKDAIFVFLNERTKFRLVLIFLTNEPSLKKRVDKWTKKRNDKTKILEKKRSFLTKFV